jgi:hypothetical protein
MAELSKAVWAKDPQGNWWKFGATGKSTEPLKIAEAGSGMSSDYESWSKDGTFTPASTVG